MLNALVQLPIGFVVALSGPLIPGPLFTYIVAKSPREGGLVGARAVVGHALVEAVILVLILVGVGTILQHAFIQRAIGIIGGVLLVVLGALSIARMSFQSSTRGIFVSYHPIVGGAMYSSVLNPTVPLWWATIGLAMLVEAYAVGAALGVVCWLVGHYLADFGWFSLVSFSAAKGGRVLSERGYRRLLLGCAVFLMVFGFYLFVKYAWL